MGGIALSATVTRSALGLLVLNINDHKDYIISTTMLGGSVTWQKQQVSSPYVDGDITITRRRPTIVEPIEIYVYGNNGTDLTNNVAKLIEAFTQDEFLMSIKINNSDRQYKCECSDYTIEYANTKYATNMTLVKLKWEKYPGPQIPHNFESRVVVEDDQDSRMEDIWMNRPLRKNGQTFYQYQMNENQLGDTVQTVFQVVRNPNWITAYIGCVIVTVGLLYQFVYHLLNFSRKRKQKAEA